MDHQVVVLFHLLCAILFVGAVAMEVLILEPVRKLIGDSGCSSASSSTSSAASAAPIRSP